MHVALDGRTVFRPNRRGTGKNLIDLYRQIATIRPNWLITIFYQPYCSIENPFAGLPNVEPRPIDIRGDRFDLWQQVRLPWAARRAGATILHCPANTAPRYPLVPLAVTIHDLIPLDPRFHQPGWRSWEKAVRRAARKARRIITPSVFSRDQIVKRFGVSADNITVNPWAADQACVPVADPQRIEATRRRYGLTPSRPYVLAFGSGDPRKNTSRVLATWARVPQSLRNEYALLVVGIEGAALAAFAEQAKNLNISNSCVLSGFADEADLPALISGAVLLWYPSLSEGFGLPILDGFACGTAVLAADATSLPEVAGDAARLVDPQDEAAMAAALAELMSDQTKREALVERGRERLKAFTWTACAERACRVFQDAAKASP